MTVAKGTIVSGGDSGGGSSSSGRCFCSDHLNESGDGGVVVVVVAVNVKEEGGCGVEGCLFKQVGTREWRNQQEFYVNEKRLA